MIGKLCGFRHLGRKRPEKQKVSGVSGAFDRDSPIPGQSLMQGFYGKGAGNSIHFCFRS